MKSQQKRLLCALIYGTLAGSVGSGGFAQAQSTSNNAQASGPSPQQTAPAQTATPAPAPSPQTLKTITVTGSLIRSVDVEMAQPVVTISAQDIQKQGFATVGQLLANLTAASTPDISKSDPLDAGPDVGGSYIDLRNLGAQRTLVLIDGKRVGTSFDGLTNLDTIPISIVDHIDVLADGASAIYGSDAIAGVINIVTKQNFNGAELDVYDGKYLPHGDGDQGQYSILFGKKYDRGSIELAAQYQNQNAISSADRPYSYYPATNNFPLNGWAPLGPQGQFTNSAGDTYVLNNGGDARNINDYHLFQNPVSNTNGVVTNPGDYYNLNPYNTLLSATSMKNLFAQGHYDILSNLTANFTASFNQQGNTALLVGSPLTTADLFSQQFPQYDDMELSSQSYYNPTNAAGQTPQALQFARTVLELPRLNVNKVENARFSLGVEGNFSIGEHLFNWDAYYYDTRYEGTILETGNFSLSNLASALGPSFAASNGQIECGTPGHVIAGCVPLNVLGRYTPAMLNYIAVNGYEHYGSSEKGPQFDLSGDVLELPAGDLSFAVGASHRNLNGYDTPDVPSGEGLTTNLAGAPTSGGYNVTEGWVEINAPLLKDIPFAQSLSLDVADRFSHYNNFGGTNNSQFKLTWKPIDDLMVRGSYGTGFRAPTVGDLYGGISTTYPGYNDPCDVVYGLAHYNTLVAKNCAKGIGGQPGLSQTALNAAGLGNEYSNGFVQEAAPGILVSSPGGEPVYAPFTAGGNANLKPETSKSSQIGIVYSPSYLTGFNATIDYFQYIVRDVISDITPNEVLNNCYELGIASDCAMFQRTATDNFQVSSLFSGEENQGWLNVAGYDVDLSYSLPKYSFGHFTLDSKSTYYTRNNTEQYAGVPVTYNNGVSSFWRLRSNFTVGWDYHNWDVTWTLRYYSPLKDGCFNEGFSAFPCTLPNYYLPGIGITPVTQIPSVTFNDVQVSWKAPWNATISLGANNIFNRVAPYFYGGFEVGSSENADSLYAYNPSYDYGRFVYMRYSQKFD